MTMNENKPTIEFTVNGKTFSVDRDVDENTRLVDFLRRSAWLTGTKVMCREGGCGACIVNLATTDPIQGNKNYRAVNSCLLPLMSCHGSEITTIEGLGSKKNGYHPVQSKLADMNGSQCGFCSSGMAMSMYSLLEKKAGKDISVKDVELALDGNICRCTGYRPIMDSFKTFAKDAPAELSSHCTDLEDLGSKLKNKPCPKTGTACSGLCSHGQNRVSGSEQKMLQFGNWYRPESLEQLMNLMKSFDEKLNYRLVAGNTGTGVYKNDGPYDAYIDITRVGELYKISETTPLTIGGAVTLSKIQDFLSTVGERNKDYWYAPILASHIGKIGSVPVRNAGSIAGNLMLKHKHNEFPSDVFIVLETVQAKMIIVNRTGETKELTLSDFLKTDMQGQIILGLILPPLSNDYKIKTYKIMPRACNAHAYINAGFSARIESDQIVEKPTIIFGGISKSMVHAIQTENYLNGKKLGDLETFQAALKLLNDELNPEQELLNPDSHYLKTVAQGLLYKFMLTILGDKVPKHISSGALDLQRAISSGKQEFDTDSKNWPVNQPTIKVEARSQCSGEAEYVDDIPVRGDELHGVFVVSTIANCQLESIDASEAMKSKGVVAFLDARNIKTGNKFVTAGSGFDSEEDEEIFCSGHVRYAGQSLGLVVARTQQEAAIAAKLVQVKYKDCMKPVLTIKEALKDPENRIKQHSAFGPANVFDAGNVEEGLLGSDQILEGEFEIGTQYHFYMETLVSISIPTEDGIDVHCATQDQDSVQTAIAECLKINKSQVNVQTRRLGGSYGGKISRSTLVAAASAVAATETGHPVRIQLDLDSNMALVGGRLPYYCKYKAGVDKDGLLSAVEMQIVSDCGSNFNEGTAFFAASFAKNCYAAKSWKFTPQLAKTDTPSNTYCRAPGTTQGIAIIENLMEHIARARREDPLEFRMKNLKQNNSEDVDPMRKIIDELRRTSNYDERLNQVKEFNRNNRWKKRGINLLPMVYPVDYPPFRYNCLVAIYHAGGSVVVQHGGIECGQGINTKVVQVTAHELGIPVEMVQVQPTNTITNANGSVTGGSMTSELVCYAAMRACQELKERMRPTKEKMPDADWKTLIEQCFNSNVDLTARHYYTPDDKVTGYTIHGATVSEVEVDVLTGENIIQRVDILEDAGQSLSPLIDIGQVEGAFIMGVGLWTSEKITYDPVTGQKLSRGTWNYKPPLNRDIPVDFRITMLKNASHPFGVLRSKATGEPPLCMSVSVFFAIRCAIDAARGDAGNLEWQSMDGPATIDKIHKMMLTKSEQFSFQ